MKKTVKILAFLLALVSLFSLCACGSDNTATAAEVNIHDVKEQIISETGITGIMDIPTNALLNFYGIQPDDVSDSDCFSTEGGGFPDEIIMVTTTGAEARDRVKEKVNNRLEGFLKQAKNYSPEDYKTASECEILICGDTVALFLSKNHAQMEDIFRKNSK